MERRVQPERAAKRTKETDREAVAAARAAYARGERDWDYVYERAMDLEAIKLNSDRVGFLASNSKQTTMAKSIRRRIPELFPDAEALKKYVEAYRKDELPLRPELQS